MLLTVSDISPKWKVCNYDFRKEIVTMYNAITEMNLWDFFNVDPPEDTGYIFWNTPEIARITRQPAVYACGHSGATEARCLRIMRKIAKEGTQFLKDD